MDLLKERKEESRRDRESKTLSHRNFKIPFSPRWTREAGAVAEAGVRDVVACGSRGWVKAGTRERGHPLSAPSLCHKKRSAVPAAGLTPEPPAAAAEPTAPPL